MKPNRTDHPGPEMALVFRNAAKTVQGRGHAKGCYQQLDGAVCAVGALVVASGMDPDDYEGQALPAVEFLESRLWLKSGNESPVERIADWNDEPGRTGAEVAAALVAAAEFLEARERAALVPLSVSMPDGSVFELASIPAHGDPRYVLAGCHNAPPSVFAELGELVGQFGAVSAVAS